MKWSISKWMFCCCVIGTIWCSGDMKAYAEEKRPENLNMRHEKKLERYKRNWARLIPQYEKIQFAGSMGVLSLGVGWDYGKKEQWETDVFLGYLPRFDGDKSHITMTLKENYIPWSLNIKQGGWMVEPFTVSIYINKIFGDEFWDRAPDKYPEKYYSFATNLRINLAFGQRISLKWISPSLSNHVTFFYEFGTNDLYLVSYFTNKYLKVPDIFNLSLGLKFKFM